MGQLLAILAGVLFAFNTMLYQRGMKKANASTAVLIDLTVGTVLFSLLVVYIAIVQGLPLLNVKGLIYAALGGIIGTMIGRIITYWAIKKIGSARTILLHLTQTLYAYFLGLLILGEVVKFYSLVGALLILSGVYWLSSEKVFSTSKVLVATAEEVANSVSDQKIVRRNQLFGIMFATLAGLSFAGADLFRKMGVLNISSPVVVSAIGGWAALLAQALMITFQKSWGDFKKIDRNSAIYFALAGAAGSLAVLSAIMALKTTSVAIVSTLESIRVWVAIAIGPIILGSREKVSKTLIGSTCLIFIGVLIIIFG